MKICKQCGNEVAENATVCPFCGASNEQAQKKKFPIWAIVLIILLIIGIPVLLFIAILTAILAPSWIKYIEKSKQYSLNNGFEQAVVMTVNEVPSETLEF